MHWDSSLGEIYVIISEERAVELTRRAVSGGADLLELRVGNIADRAQYKLAREIRDITRSRATRLIINNRPDIARAIDADGVHLGQDDLPINSGGAIMGADKIIGLSTHSLAQAEEAQRSGASYISVGPVWSTPTKPEYPPVGLELVRQAAQKIKIPFFAIGGINLTNVEEVIKAGARRIAVVRAFTEAEDPQEAIRQLREKINDAVRACRQR